MEGFRTGFWLGYQGEYKVKICDNHRSMDGTSPEAQKKMRREISLGRIIGPYDRPPFPLFRSSPLGLIPKKDPGSFRLIHDLSFPRGDSVNDSIPEEHSRVKYDTVEYVVSMAQFLGQGALIAKCDLTDAFRLIPLHCSQYPLTGMKFEGKFWFDRTLPMGASSSCAIFESFSTALVFALEDRFGFNFVSHLIDDFVFLGPPNSSMCLKALLTFFAMGEYIGLPFKKEKTVYPSTKVEVYGLLVDTISQEVSLPQDKLRKLKENIKGLSGVRTIPVRQLQSILGLLNYASYVIAPGRAFLRRLFDLLKGHRKTHHIFITREARADLRAWECFCTSFNGRSFFRILSAQPDFKIFTDASGTIAGAAVFGAEWLVYPWPKYLDNSHITVKELVPVNLAISTWGEFMRNRRVRAICDNTAVVHIINNQSSRNPEVMVWVRNLVLLILKFNICLEAEHVCGKHNFVPDKLSRFQFTEARRRAPWLRVAPTQWRDPFVIWTG